MRTSCRGQRGVQLPRTRVASMSLLSLLLLLVCVLQLLGGGGVVRAHGPPAPADTRVVTLTSENFDAYVGQPDRYVFVLYCARWVQQCKQLEALWADLSLSQSERQHSDVFVAARVDGDASPELMRRMNISGYPTMMYYTPLEPQGLEYNSMPELVLLDSFVFQFT